MNNKIITIALVLIIGFAGLLVWAARESSKPQPGEILPELGREHVTDITGIEYNSNPPTSGTHFPVWAKKGVYDRVISDGHLIHSLEHGYVVISYNCEKKRVSGVSSVSRVSRGFGVQKAFAHEGEEVQGSSATGSAAPLHRMNVELESGMGSFTPQNPPAVEVMLSEAFNSDSCKKLVAQLSEFTKKYNRVIVVPRPTLDVPIALTAWTKLLKLQKFEKEAMDEFINAYHNKGPEATME